jgi:hypothetical protein
LPFPPEFNPICAVTARFPDCRSAPVGDTQSVKLQNDRYGEKRGAISLPFKR